MRAPATGLAALVSVMDEVAWQNLRWGWRGTGVFTGATSSSDSVIDRFVAEDHASRTHTYRRLNASKFHTGSDLCSH